MVSKRFLFTVFTVLVILTGATIAVFLAKGYTFSPQEKRLVGTGIISVTSTPDAASVYVDGHLTTATNSTVTLSPRDYTVKVIKEGFIPWEKKVTVKEGLVTDLKITLFPAIPTIYPLTFTGIASPVLSPDFGQLAYVVPLTTNNSKKAGVWVWSMTDNRPIAFARGAQPHQIASSLITDYSKAKLHWSADSKQVLATVEANNYLLNADSLNSDPRDITPTLATTLKGWETDQKTADNARINVIPDQNLRQIASNSAVLKWSPDETKFMFAAAEQPGDKRATSNEQPETNRDETNLKFKVADLETGDQYDLPSAKLHFWLPDSRHVVLVEESQVSIADFDGTNKAVIYAGNFLDSLVFAWPDYSRLVIVSSVPTPTASEPNLFGINLK
ncbi:MAG: PEGA domain-containing protein [Candidatus Daviesbacteria bacterium]|nr:MAG: PEGA domain-containing protein [Candidatus Daviesbacteria bacterium]